MGIDVGHARRDPVVIALLAAIVGYAAVALVHHWWVSGVVAVAAAILLWRRHPRARFTVYILLSAVLLRAVFGHSWPLLLFAVVALALLQTPGARREWPRLTPGARPGRAPTRRDAGQDGPQRGDRMTAP